MTTLFVIFLMFLCGALTQLQNSLMEQPRVSCEQSRIKMFIHTWLPFSGSVYAKGFFHKDICRVQGNGIGHTANITIPVSADCGMRRRRNMNPNGLSLEMDCFTVNGDWPNNETGHFKRISEINFLIILKSQNVPKCRYQVLSSEKGEQISFAAIGQPIIHKWICNGVGNGDEGIYCLTVHSCQVDDGQGNTQKLLDENGCPIDDALFGSIEYKTDLEAIQRGNAFKFADRTTIYFNCQLRLELKNGWKECQRSECAAVTALPPVLENNQATTQSENQIIDDEMTVDGYLNTSLTTTIGYIRNKSSQNEFSEETLKEDKMNYIKVEEKGTKIFKNHEGIERKKKNQEEENENKECKQFSLKFGLNDECNEEESLISLNQQRSSRSSNEGINFNLPRNERKKKRFWRNSDKIKMDIEVNKAIDVFDLMNSQTGKEGINSIDKVTTLAFRDDLPFRALLLFRARLPFRAQFTTSSHFTISSPFVIFLWEK
uniref:ZP domain-containing protein n=1 Tax=Meloidogyne hapla TaxID=6305 RepID=A0A1I8B1B1_MELHA